MSWRTLFRALVVVAIGATAGRAQSPGRWTPEKANAWYAERPWLVGCNYIHPAAIDRELSWAEGLGFSSVRVFLHDLLWKQDSAGLLKRMEQFLEIADRHKIGVMFVPLDSVWDPNPKLGTQRAPRPHVHNSGWVQSPGRAIIEDAARHEELKPYIQGVIGHFKNDKRVHAWDLINEPDNTNGSSYGSQEPGNKKEMALELLRKVFAWAREVNLSQPLTSGVWIGTWTDPAKLSPMEKLQLGESDIITFHSYAPVDEVKTCIASLRRYGRPVLCTEYMARPRGSTFDPILALFKEEKVGAYNWGFVDGKSQTIYPWDSWQKTYTAEPPVWFHDIFRRDGTAYREEEVSYIRKVTGVAK
jgi:hypothetical protein